jgi:cytochrome c peroxidase
MNNKPGHVIKTLKSMPEYVELFKKAFPDETDPVTFNNVAKAIEVFEATLLTPHSPLDRFMAGDSQALTEVQKEGLGLFIDRGCSSCHYGVNLGGKGYYPFGVVAAPEDEVRPPGDLGRYQLTNTSGDRYVFKSPILRNVALTPPYFHSGKVWNLLDAAKIMGSAQLGYEVTDDEAEKIVEFLGALTGDQPQVRYPILPPNSNTTPRPILTFGK